MADDREIAKQNATPVPVPEEGSASNSENAGRLNTAASTAQPSLRDAMSSADVLKSELQQQKHLQAMKTKERGWFGIVFGTESLAAIVIAAAVILMSFATAVGFELLGARTHQTEFWSHEAQPVWAIVTAALGFIFGRSNKNP